MNSIQDYKLYRLARGAARRVYRKLRQLTHAQLKVVTLEPASGSRGNVLLSYILDPFLLPAGQPIPNSHSNHWESVLMAKTFLDLNYSVDVIAWTNNIFMPKKRYDFFVDSRWNLQRLAPRLNPDCIKILHIDVCHILFQNAAEAGRLLALQRRRGITLRPRRFEQPNLGIEFADCATVLGNQFTLDTFRYARKPMYPVPIIPCGGYPWPKDKKFEACRKRFLWFGSGGLVRKGLDLVLEAFAGMPDYHLTVCGPVHGDQDFERAYHKELYQTANIETTGWLDIDGPRFREICNQSLALIYPSCAEGQCGGVVTSMHAGLIPVISYESGVDVHDFGIILPQCSIEEIRNAVRRVSALPARRLETMARAAWESARTNHTKEKFAREYRKVIEGLLATRAPANATCRTAVGGVPGSLQQAWANTALTAPAAALSQRLGQGPG